MADSSSLLLLKVAPLVGSDAAPLEDDLGGREAWPPSFVLQTPYETGVAVSGTGLAANGDYWYVGLCPPSKMPGYVFYLISFQATLVATNANTNLDALFGTHAAYNVNKPKSGTHGWVMFPLTDDGLSIYDGTLTQRLVSVTPNLYGLPTRPYTATSDTVADNALGALCFTVGTWNATAAGATQLHVDARWLAYPEAIQRAPGFYMPRLYSSLN